PFTLLNVRPPSSERYSPRLPTAAYSLRGLVGSTAKARSRAFGRPLVLASRQVRPPSRLLASRSGPAAHIVRRFTWTMLIVSRPARAKGCQLRPPSVLSSIPEGVPSKSLLGFAGSTASEWNSA